MTINHNPEGNDRGCDRKSHHPHLSNHVLKEIFGRTDIHTHSKGLKDPHHVGKDLLDTAHGLQDLYGGHKEEAKKHFVQSEKDLKEERSLIKNSEKAGSKIEEDLKHHDKAAALKDLDDLIKHLSPNKYNRKDEKDFEAAKKALEHGGKDAEERALKDMTHGVTVLERRGSAVKHSTADLTAAEKALAAGDLHKAEQAAIKSAHDLGTQHPDDPKPAPRH